MNTGFLGPAVATVLTVYGIETEKHKKDEEQKYKLQQYLPFTVLKLRFQSHFWKSKELRCNSTYRLRY